MQNKLLPIFIAHGYCTRVTGDCVGDHLISCDDTNFRYLSCDIWGVTNREAINKILVTAIQSNMDIRRLTFWKEQEVENYNTPLEYFKSFFKKPVVEYINRIRK